MPATKQSLSTAKMNSYQPRLKVAYQQVIRPKLKKELGLKNIHQVPLLEKIVLSCGLGRVKDDKQIFQVAKNTLSKISGQTPQLTTARMSIANFKLRSGQKIGLKVTLRDQKMYEFLDRLINLVMPRLRDFRGAALKSFDKNGHYSIGFQEQGIFPELSFEETRPTHGLQATLIFKSQKPSHVSALLTEFGFKFEKSKSKGGSTNG